MAAHHTVALCTQVAPCVPWCSFRGSGPLGDRAVWFDDPVRTLPLSLQARLAAVILLGIFFVPFATSDLRGLTHVLSCEDSVTATLYVGDGGDDGTTVLGSADSVTREEVGLGLCGGLLVDLQLTSAVDDRATVRVAITNATETDWQGTVALSVDGTAVPVAIGAIDAEETGVDDIELRVRSGRDYEITGTLLIGP